MLPVHVADMFEHTHDRMEDELRRLLGVLGGAVGEQLAERLRALGEVGLDDVAHRFRVERGYFVGACFHLFYCLLKNATVIFVER